MTKVKNMASTANQAHEKAKKEISVLQQKIEKINSLSKSVKKREVFDLKKNQLHSYLVSAQKDEDFLSEEDFKIRFTSGKYSRDEVFTIGNPPVVQNAIQFFISLFDKEIIKQDAEIENLMKL